MSHVREASLEPERGGLPGGVALQAGPFALLAAGAIWLWARWSEVPERVPAHWNLQGKVDRFVSRSVSGVGGPLLIGAAVCVLLLAIQAGIRHGAARSALRRPSLWILLAAEYLTAVACCGAVAAMATAGRMLTPALVVSCTAALVLLVATLGMALNVPRPTARNRGAWHAGVFYVDREDPALFVPKRIGVGYTMNFGNPRAVALAFGLTALSLLVAILAISAR